MVTCKRVASESSLERLRLERIKFELDEKAKLVDQDLTERERGFKAGFDWAESESSYDELLSLSGEFDGTHEHLIAVEVAEIIGGDPEGVWGVSGDELTTDFVAGWVAGALDLYRQI